MGYSTIIEGEGKNIIGKGPIRTGVTAIFPRGKASKFSPVFANWYSLNGNGEMTGTTWVTESGFLETPIMITNTNSVGAIRQAVLKWFVDIDWYNGENWWYTYPVVAETYDGFLNDIYGFHVKEEHVLEAIENSAGGEIAEGNVGGGTGMMCLGFKGGTGTASRVIEINDTSYTVGVLVQSNFGAKKNLTIAGVPVGSPSAEVLHTYVTHLKSSPGPTNEQLRLVMAETLMDHVSLLPPESNIIVAGDFNVYNSTEPAYELLLSANEANTLRDPIDMPGWGDDEFPNKEIYTQSTRLNSLSDGSGGGLDDRFDFVLLSDQLMNPEAKITYQEESYKALGNNGTCYNQDLLDCTTEDNIPFDLLRALYYMSDHLPIILNLDIQEEEVSVNELLSLTNQPMDIFPNPASAQITLVRPGRGVFDFRILNLQGKLMLQTEHLRQTETIDIAHLAQGLYIAQISDKDGRLFETAKLLIQR